MKKFVFTLFFVCFSTYSFERVDKNIITDEIKEKQTIPAKLDDVKQPMENNVHNVVNQKSPITGHMLKIPDNKEDNSKHILMFHPFGTKSHRNQINALLLGLLDKGYKVTGVFPSKSDIQKQGFTEIVVKDRFASIIKLYTDMMIEKDGTDFFTQMSLWPVIFPMWNEIFDGLLVDYKIVMDSIEERNLTVDAIIVTGMFSFSGWYFEKIYKCPFILINPIGPLPHGSKFFGNIENPSFQPAMELGFVEPLGFRQRLANTLFYGFMEVIQVVFISHLPFEKLGVDINDLEELTNSYSLLLLCSHFVTHSPQAYVANTVEIGGIHCQDGQPLPEDLQKFMDNSPQGVVYVSFGSAVKPNQMSLERKQIFLETFRQLKIPVIWKWNEDTIPNLPPNVKLSKWLPQQDLLAHPNLKVFVTHGGLLSLQEALYHQTPLVGIPLGTDQKPNLLRAQNKGYAIMLDWTTLDTQGFLAAINTAINNEEVKNNMKKAHNLFVDEKETPLERAVWWVEYVIRHQGAQFLKPHSLSLSWYQFYLLDVICLITLVLLVSMFIAYKCCICCKNTCCNSWKKYKEE